MKIAYKKIILISIIVTLLALVTLISTCMLGPRIKFQDIDEAAFNNFDKKETINTALEKYKIEKGVYLRNFSPPEPDLDTSNIWDTYFWIYSDHIIQGLSITKFSIYPLIGDTSPLVFSTAVPMELNIIDNTKQFTKYIYFMDFAQIADATDNKRIDELLASLTNAKPKPKQAIFRLVTEVTYQNNGTKFNKEIETIFVGWTHYSTLWFDMQTRYKIFGIF